MMRMVHRYLSSILDSKIPLDIFCFLRDAFSLVSRGHQAQCPHSKLRNIQKANVPDLAPRE
eukprot:753455-Hanusia_phi.AAC.3